MVNDKIVNIFMKSYTSPLVSEQPIYNTSVLCSSGSPRTSSNIGIEGGDKSGNVADAF